MISLGNNIKYARKKLGLTQEELAAQIGVTPQAISKWEKGTGMPDISMIVPLAQTLSVSTDTLFGLVETNLDDSVYIGITRDLEKILADSASPAEAALAKCQYLLEQVQQNPAHFIYECCYVESAANLSRYADFDKFCPDKWPEFRDMAIKYGTHVIRFCTKPEWTERTHFALAWIYIHEKNYTSARDHISTLPSISSNRLQESILAQLASFESGLEGMKEVLRNNLQKFTRALNKEVLYALEDYAWYDDPQNAVDFATWGLDIIHTLSKNKDLISYTRGFTRDIYKYLLHADLRMEAYDAAAQHWKDLAGEMQAHYDFYQTLLANPAELSKYDDRQIQYMDAYTPEFMEQKKQSILDALRSWHGEENVNQFLQKLI